MGGNFDDSPPVQVLEGTFEEGGGYSTHQSIHSTYTIEDIHQSIYLSIHSSIHSGSGQQDL